MSKDTKLSNQAPLAAERAQASGAASGRPATDPPPCFHPTGRFSAERKAQAIREVVDPFDQQEDIDAAVSYVYGEPMVDKDRIGIWGTSFGGGHVIYRAAHDSRIACVVAQVGSMPDDWTGRFSAGLKAVYKQKSDRARGEGIDT